ncbi:Ig-like domain-containing protein [Mucilaginibacter gilvus]|uniref:Ig-like domain-containing protein n=1 Tax=Mucilaginibacter gilvus TaxID=2305909 RepID=UPI001ABB62E2|nr:gliding motility-associated C-terminal domain-containing protein [Mucilaginibacter gilvus]
MLTYDSFYQVTVQPIVAIANNTATAPAVSAFCATGDPAIITASAPTGGNSVFTYQWQNSADNLTFANITGATAKDYDPAVLTATTYYQRIVSSGTCNTPTKSTVVKITVIPAIDNNTITAPAVTTFCSTGDASAITGSTPTGGDGTYQYQWQSSVDNVNFNAIPATAIKDYNPAATSVTTYYRRQVTSGACNLPVFSNTVTITILPQPANVILTPVAAVCTGSRAVISVSSPNASLTYLWYSSPAKTSVLFTGPTYTTDPLNASQPFYVETSNGICTSAILTSITVTVTPAPVAPTLVTNPLFVCSGTPATLDVASPQAALTYKWYSAAAGGTPVFTGPQFVTAPLTGNTIYYVDATNTTGCISPRTAVNVTINAAPSIATQGATVCAGSGTTLTATSTDNNVTINWYANATGGNSIFTGASFPTPAVNAATTYYAGATNNLSGCVSPSRAAAAIQLAQPLPAPVVTAGDVTATSVSFRWEPVPNATGYQQSLDNGLTFTNVATGNAGVTTSVQGLTAGQTVTVIIRATGPLNCQVSNNSNAVTLTATDPLANQLYVANAFTPNGDGKNDIVYVHSENINTLKFSVYDQWGEMLFSSISVQNGWDGTYKGKVQPAGVYVYYVQATMKDGKALNKKGTITLIR